MGRLIELRCTGCGMRRPDLLDGTGFSMTRDVMLCTNCMEVVSILVERHRYRKPFHVIGRYDPECPLCQGECLAEWGERREAPPPDEDEIDSEVAWIWRFEDIWLEEAACPRCGGDVEVRVTGHWD